MSNSPENEQPQPAASEPFAQDTAPVPTPTPQPPVPQPPVPQPPVRPAGWGHPAPTPPVDPFVPATNSTTESATADPPPPASVHSRRLWVSVVGAAAAAALVASLATAGLTGAFGAADAATTPSSLATIGRSSTDTAPVSGSTSDDPAWEKVAAAVSASVVAIQVTTASGGGEGSGVIIDDSGNVLTNNHVVAGAADNTVQVTLSDGRLYKATIVGADATTDLAVVRITDAPSDLAPAALGDSGAVVVGEAVMAVGNPLGLANTVTTGIVSAVDRPVSAQAESGADTVVTNAIQIDAAINPGNSGGPLFDAQGRVIGITSSIATLSGSSSQSGSIGLGFAIPINLAQAVAGQLVQSGTAEHAFLGVSLTDGEGTADGATRRGAVVEQVTDGSPASQAGVRTGDVVVAIDGDPVAGAESLTAFVRERAAGSEARLTVVRDGKALDVTVTLAAKAATVDQSSNDRQRDPNQDRSGQDRSGRNGQNPPDPSFGDRG